VNARAITTATLSTSSSTSVTIQTATTMTRSCPIPAPQPGASPQDLSSSSDRLLPTAGDLAVVRMMRLRQPIIGGRAHEEVLP
jgi:hypothetical protein